MKTIRTVFLAASVIFSPNLLHTQTALVGSINNNLAPVQPPVPDSIVQITAEMQGLQAVQFGDLPQFGTYWEVMPGGGMAPLPAPVFDPSLPIYAIAGNIYLVDASYGQLPVNPSQTSMLSASSATSATAAAVQAEATAVANLIDQVQAASATSLAASSTTMSATDASGPTLPGTGSGSTNSYTPNLTGTGVNYGTNLFLANVSVTNQWLAALASNTVPGVSYTIQWTTNLLAPQGWQNNGTIVGSTLTNWTAWSLPRGNWTNLFLRLRSEISSDGTGLPDWWEELYFGTNAVNPDAQDSAGDGYTIYQKYELGVPPGQFLTPPAPTGFSAAYNSSSGNVVLTWQPSQGLVTGYKITRLNPNYYTTNNYYPSSIATSFVDNSPITVFPPEHGEPTYAITAIYTKGNSASATAAMFTPTNTVSGQIYANAQGQEELLLQGPIPTGTTTLLLTCSDFNWNTYSYSQTKHSLPVSSLNNNSALLSMAWFNSSSMTDGDEDWYVQTVNGNGNASDMTLAGSLSWRSGFPTQTPFLDGRQQLAQNAAFLLRVANCQNPFNCAIIQNGYSYPTVGYNYPQYSYAGLNDVTYVPGSRYNASLYVDPYPPFAENYFFHNFVFSKDDLDPATGQLTTGLGLGYVWIDLYATMPEYPTHFFEYTGDTVIPAILDPYETPFTCYYPQSEEPDQTYAGFPQNLWYYGVGGVDGSGNYDMLNTASNYFGLQFISAEFAYNTNGLLQTPILEAGQAISGVLDGGLFSRTAIPQLRTVDYYFAQPQSYPLPGEDAFSSDLPNNTNNLVAGFGQSSLFAGYAKQQLLNGYPGVYSYLGQYFDQTYQIDASGNVTTNSAGFISPYGEFTPTAVGPVALVTMTNWGENVRGTGVVQVVKLVLDVNHDGTMDLSFTGPDNTSPSSPYVLWANNNFDRWALDKDDGTNYMDDVYQYRMPAAGCPYTPNTPTPDCNYCDQYGLRQIPCTRDLQDFFRLWVCGITPGLLTNLPAGSTITLNWGDVGNPNTGNPTIDLFQAVEADGGIGYLTNETVAMQQINPAYSSHIGRLGPGQSIQLNSSYWSGWAGNHFLMCGVSNGTGGLNLTIKDGNGNVLAQSTSYLQILDIKQMYERWTVGENPNVVPLTNALPATEDLPMGVTGFRYTQPQDTTTPYILFVHGWNMERWEKDRFAESAFKRLYWQDYKGRFGVFRWPTAYGFTGDFSQLLSNPQEKDNFDNSENNALPSHRKLKKRLEIS